MLLEIKSVNISEKKGTVKQAVKEIILTSEGIFNDAHAHLKNRQVSLLGVESIRKFERETKRSIQYGEFAENITTEGLKLNECRILDRFKNEHIELELTQIGKKCHGDNCAIFKEVGNCVMPKEGIFCRIIKGGRACAGDSLYYLPKSFKTMIITLSDRVFV
jgi:MOSC domain-containing protein YiiM